MLIAQAPYAVASAEVLGQHILEFRSVTRFYGRRGEACVIMFISQNFYIILAGISVEK